MLNQEILEAGSMSDWNKFAWEMYALQYNWSSPWKGPWLQIKIKPSVIQVRKHNWKGDVTTRETDEMHSTSAGFVCVKPNLPERKTQPQNNMSFKSKWPRFEYVQRVHRCSECWLLKASKQTQIQVKHQ